MPQSDNGGYNGLKAFAFTVGVTVLIFTILYITKRYNPNLFAQEAFARSYSWYLRGQDDPLEIGSERRRRSLGEEPRMWDVWISSWYPPCSRPLSPPERLGLGQGQVEDEKHDPSCAGWTEFLPLSADKVSDADTALSSPQVRGDNPVQLMPSAQIQVNTIILMPALPRSTPSPSTSSPNTAPQDAYGPQREYALGTSCIPHTPGD